MKTIAELNEKIWYRLLKVLHIGLFFTCIIISTLIILSYIGEPNKTQINIQDSKGYQKIIEGISVETENIIKNTLFDESDKVNKIWYDKDKTKNIFDKKIIEEIIIGENLEIIKREHSKNSPVLNEYIDYLYKFKDEIISENTKIEKQKKKYENEFILKITLYILLFGGLSIIINYLFFFKFLNKLFYYIIFGNFNQKI